MSCLQQALNGQGVHYNNYYASEIDKFAIKVTQANYPNTIQMGSVTDINPDELPIIDLFGGGSPCQSFSFAGKRKGMSTKDEVEILTLEHYLQLKSEGYEFEGQSYLFWEYMRLLTAFRKKNPNVKFILENVMMGEKWEKVLTKAIGVHPIEINSALVSAQNRRRLYWTNIGMVPSGLFGDMSHTIQQPEDRFILLGDILEDNVPDKYFLKDETVQKLQDWEARNKENGNGFKVEFKTADSKSAVLSTGSMKSSSTFLKIGKDGKVKNNQDKASCFTAGANSGGNHSDMDLIVHNMMPRSGDPKKGGTGHLSRRDGKTYCLDTGNTNAVEVKGMDFRYDEGFRVRENGKSGTAHTSNHCGKFEQIGRNVRRLTPTECERLQTVTDGYTNHVSDTQRYRMLGNGWTVEVIKHILSYL